MKHPHVPRTWTGREALAVAEWLHGLIDDVFDVYRDEIRVEVLARELARDALEITAERVAPKPAEDLGPF